MISQTGVPVNVISQSDIIRFYVDCLDSIQNVHSQTIEETGLGLNHLALELVNENILTIEALKKMKDKAVSALGIINDQGVLTGNFSASDLKGAVITEAKTSTEAFGNLLLPLKTFMSRTGMAKPPITCTISTTVCMVLIQLTVSKVHRIWIVDQYSKPIGFITLTDLMPWLLKAD